MLTEFSSTDCDELSDSLAHTEQVFRQLKSGQFSGQWQLLELPGVSIVEDQISHGIYNSATISEGFSVAFLPIRQRGTLMLDGHSWDDPALFLAQPRTRPILSIPSDFASYTVEFNLQCLQRTAGALGVSPPSPRAGARVIPDQATCAAAGELIARALCTVDGCRALNPQQRADEFMIGWLNLLGQAAGQQQPIDRSTLQQRRRAALEAADYMKAHLGEDLSLADLCEAVGVTDRTLRSGFQEVFGVSPKRWLKRERLSAARRELKSSDPKRTHVRTIAVKYGFLQFAHFATDYRKQFGERPSETLTQT